MFLTKSISALVLGITLISCANISYAAKLYRWVDQEGNVHYTDKVPPEHARQARTQLNERGLEVEHTGAAKTEEEIQQERELKRLRAEREKLLKEQQAKDRVLLRTFRTEEDILLARDGKLAAVDVMIQIARSNILRSKNKLSDMQSNAASFERQGKKTPKKLIQNIETAKKQLQDGYNTIIRQEQKKNDISQKYEGHIARFRTLKNLNQDSATKDKEKRTRDTILNTLASCDEPSSCNEIWQKAERYVRKHATTRLQMVSNTVIITAPPKTDKDISLTVSRIKRDEGVKIFLDLQCSNSANGQKLCGSEKALEIRSGFKAALLAQEP